MRYYDRLREVRERYEMSQRQVAAILHCDQRAYSNYETGKRAIPLRHIITLADYYGVSIDYLVGRTNRRTMLL